MSKMYNCQVKVLCMRCNDNRIQGKRIEMDCFSCKRITRHNVNDLLRFLKYIDGWSLGWWVWWTVYDKQTNDKLYTYKNYKKDYSVDSFGVRTELGTSRDIPYSKTI